MLTIIAKHHMKKIESKIPVMDDHTPVRMVITKKNKNVTNVDKNRR